VPVYLTCGLAIFVSQSDDVTSTLFALYTAKSAYLWTDIAKTNSLPALAVEKLEIGPA
jgi:hypothetical protein